MFKNENGSMAVYVTVVLLTMLLLITAVFFLSSSARKIQLQTAIQVKQTYEADNSKAAEIYDRLTGNDSNTPTYVSDGLILHYDAINNTGNGHSNNTTTWKDLSGNGNDGIVTGGNWGDSYLRFTSSTEQNGVKTNRNFPIDFSNTFNIVFKLSSVNSVEALFGSRTSVSDGMMLFNYSTNDNLSLDTKGSNTRIALGDRLSANTIYDISITFSGTTCKLYVNGQLTNTETFTDATINFPLTVFTAGTRSNSLGDIYSVKVYNRALTDAEIQQNHNIDSQTYKF